MLRLGQIGSDPSAVCGPFGNHTIIDMFEVYTDELRKETTIVAATIDFLLSSTIIMPGVFIMLYVWVSLFQ